jgi:hypothetical protein
MMHLSRSLHARQAGASFTLSCIALLLSGCAWLDVFRPIPTITDVQVEEVRLVLNLHIPFEARAYAPDDQQVLLVTISSGLDLYEFSRSHQTGMWPQSRLCRDGRADTVRNSPFLRMVAANWRPGSAPRHPLTPREDGRFAYLLALPANSARYPSTDPFWTFVAYDFRQLNLDICFYFQGGDGLYGRQHRSLDFRIPYAMIAEALARAGEPHAALP